MNPLVLRASLLVALLLTLTARASSAEQSSETLLPDTTKGYLSIPDWGRMENDFNATQLGELANDEIMRPFIEDLKKQIRQSGMRRLERLGVTLEEMRAIVGGEVALAILQPNETSAAALLLVDVTGHEREARELLDRMADNLAKQGGRRLRTATDSSVAVFELPRREGERQGRQTASFLKGSLLCIGDDVRAVEDVLRATTSERKNSLASLPAFRESTARLEAARGENGPAPHIRWFLEPFGYAECMRILDPPKDKPQPDVLRALRRQGFTAVRGLGGHVTFAAERYELLHRTMIFAPPVAQDDAKSDERYRQAARMLDFPNSENLKPESWVPRDLATYSTWNWNLQKAFEASKSLVDELFSDPGDEILESILADLRDARDGPRVDLEKDLVGKLGGRITLLTDYQTPIGPKSERWIAGVATSDPKTVATALEKAMKNEANVRRREIEGFTVWEVVEQQAAQTEDLVIEVPGGRVRHADLEVEEFVAFQPGKAREKLRRKRPQRQQPQQRVIQNVALTVAYDHLFVASHIDLLERVLKQAGAQRGANDRSTTVEDLGIAADYRRVAEEMSALGAESIAAQFFSRSDEAFRINYELLRTNEMPKSQSILGKILNEMLGDGKPGAVRRARLDGSKLPSYDAVRRYLGPAGTFVVTQQDGWFVTGFMLNKEMMSAKPE